MSIYTIYSDFMKSDYKNYIKVKSILFFLFIICTNNNFAAGNITNQSYNTIEHKNDYSQQQDSAYRGRGSNYRGRGSNYRGRGYNYSRGRGSNYRGRGYNYRGRGYNYNRGRGSNYIGRDSAMDELKTTRNEKDNKIEKAEDKNFSHIKANAESSHGDNKNINKNIKKDLLPIKRDVGSFQGEDMVHSLGVPSCSSKHRAHPSSSNDSSSSFNDFSESEDPEDRRFQYSYLFDFHSLLVTNTDTGLDTILAKHGLKNVVDCYNKVKESINRGLCGFRIAVNTDDLFSFLSHGAVKEKIDLVNTYSFKFFVIDYVLPVKKNDKKHVTLSFLNDFIRRHEKFKYPIETALCIDNKMYSFGKTKTNDDIFWKEDKSCYELGGSFRPNVFFSLSPTKRHTVIAISYTEYPDFYCPLRKDRQARITIFNIIPLKKDSKKFYEWMKRKEFKLDEFKEIDSWFFPNDVSEKNIKIDSNKKKINIDNNRSQLFSDNKKQGRGYHKNNVKGEIQNSAIKQKKKNKKIGQENKKVVSFIKNFKEKDDDKQEEEEPNFYEEDEKDDDKQEEEPNFYEEDEKDDDVNNNGNNNQDGNEDPAPPAKAF